MTGLVSRQPRNLSASLSDRAGWTSRIEGLVAASTTSILCLGIGAPAEDRTAQIQLALLLELAVSLKVRSRSSAAAHPQVPFNDVEIYDPVWTQLDRDVLDVFGLKVVSENMVSAFHFRSCVCSLAIVGETPAETDGRLCRLHAALPQGPIRELPDGELLSTLGSFPGLRPARQ